MRISYVIGLMAGIVFTLAASTHVDLVRARGDEASVDPDRKFQQAPGGRADQGRCLRHWPVWERPGFRGTFVLPGRDEQRMITRASFRGHVAVGEFHTDRDTYLGRDTYLLTAIPPSACEITNIAELPSRVGTSISGRSTGPRRLDL
jgi:hypothetical protein